MSTPDIHSEMSSLRDLVNHNVLVGNQKRFDLVWEMVCASMDLIEDTQLAIDSFGSGPASEGFRYLEVYGLFQAIFLQQDALQNLTAGLRAGSFKPFDDPDMGEIRDIRNKYFGHPSKRDRPGPTTYHGLSRITVNYAAITGWTYPNFHTETINMDDIVHRQENGTRKALGDIYLRLADKLKEYLMTFAGQALPADDCSYLFEKLCTWAVDPSNDREAMAEVGLNAIRESVDQIKDGVAKRYDNGGAPGDIERMIDKARFCVDHLHDAMAGSSKAGFDNEVYAQSLRSTYHEIVEMCVAINEEFSVSDQEDM